MSCPKCGANEPHFCPPSLGEPGFYLCEPRTDEHTIPVLRAPWRPIVTVVSGEQTEKEFWLVQPDTEDGLTQYLDKLRAKLQAAEIDTEVVKDLLTTERECNADLRRILGHTPELDPEATYKSLHHDYIIVRDNRDELSTKLQAAELVIKEMSGAQFGLYHNRLRDGSGKCGEPCGVCRAETAEAECAALVAQRDALPQTEMALRTEVARLEAEVARLQSEIQLITAPIEAGGGENARLRTRIAELEAEVARLLDVGADAFHEVNTLHAAKDAMETDLIYVTSQMDEHPDGYEGPCWCRVCRSYATDDGEDGK